MKKFCISLFHFLGGATSFGLVASWIPVFLAIYYPEAFQNVSALHFGGYVFMFFFFGLGVFLAISAIGFVAGFAFYFFSKSRSSDREVVDTVRHGSEMENSTLEKSIFDLVRRSSGHWPMPELQRCLAQEKSFAAKTVNFFRSEEGAIVAKMYVRALENLIREKSE